MKRVISLFICVLCALPLLAQPQQRQFPFQAQPQDWPKVNRYAAANEALTERPKAVFMGDSITDSWPNEDPAFFKDNNFVGRGISGQATFQMLVRFRPDVIDLNPEYVVILGGTNDVAQNHSIWDIDISMANIISMCELAKANGIKPILCSVLPSNRFYWKPEAQPEDEIVKLNERIKAYAQSANIPYVDYHSAMKNKYNAMDDRYSWDGCHPLITGYKLMESLVLPYIK